MIDIDKLTDQVDKAKEKDTESFIYLFNETKDYTYTIAYSLVGNIAEAQDIVQEVYFKIFLRLATLRDSHNFLRWLHTITFNISQDHLRMQKRRDQTIELLSEENDAADTVFDAWLHDSWKQETIHNMIRTLPEEQRDAVYLYYFKQKTITEIAAMQSCSLNTVKSRLYYARNTLKKLIEAEEEKSGRMHLAPLVTAISAIMVMPQFLYTLQQADSVRILMAVLTAAGSVSNDFSVIDIQDTTDDASAKKHAGHRKKILRFRGASVLLLAAAVVCICAALAAAGYTYGLRHPDLPAFLRASSSNADEMQNSSAVQNTSEPLSADNPPSEAAVSAASADAPPVSESVSESVIVAEGACGDAAVYTLAEDGTLTVRGTGRVGYITDWESSDDEDMSIFSAEALQPLKTAVLSLVIEEGITEIVDGAFMYFPSLCTVSLPESCTVIGDAAFAYCPMLQACVIPSGVSEIGAWTFKECTNLGTIVLPEQLQYIGDGAFFLCNSLYEITFTGNLPLDIGTHSFYGTDSLTHLDFPASTRYIGREAFNGCSLTEVDLQHTDAVIDTYAFRNSEKLQTVYLPESVSVLKEGVFHQCTSLTYVDLGDSLISISNKAFNYSGVKVLEIPASVIIIESDAFLNMSNLSAVYVDDDNPNYCDRDGVLFDRDLKNLILYPQAKEGSVYHVPESVIYIGRRAVYRPNDLTQLYLNASLSVLEEHCIVPYFRTFDIYFSGDVPAYWTENAIVPDIKLKLHFSAGAAGWEEGQWTAPDGNIFTVVSE